MKKIKILIIDDSDFFLDTIHHILKKQDDMEIVGTANDVYEARDKIIRYKPDVLTLDIIMPKMDGVTFLKKLLPQYPIPVVVISSRVKKGSQTSYDALEAGAIECLLKPSNHSGEGLKKFTQELIHKIKIAAHANIPPPKPSSANTKPPSAIKHEKKSIDAILIGASTGGTEAIKAILSQLPPVLPGMVIVQHMPKEFVPLFAQTLRNKTSFEVLTGESGMNVKKGRVIIAPGDLHTTIEKKGNTVFIKTSMESKRNGHRPSVDILFESGAKNLKKRTSGVLLTGMGKDGAEGMKYLKEAQCLTFAQNKETSVVYGMPAEAVKLKSVDFQLSLDKIATSLLDFFSI